MIFFFFFLLIFGIDFKWKNIEKKKRNEDNCYSDILIETRFRKKKPPTGLVHNILLVVIQNVRMDKM